MRMGILDSRVALVTGASKDIGAGIAKGLAAAGASVLLDGFELLVIGVVAPAMAGLLHIAPNQFGGVMPTRNHA
jgi:NAD(P)-dependent dehydrogenase (short-subunit alcohol dehydrogenase family)